MVTLWDSTVVVWRPLVAKGCRTSVSLELCAASVQPKGHQHGPVQVQNSTATQALWEPSLVSAPHTARHTCPECRKGVPVHQGQWVLAQPGARGGSQPRSHSEAEGYVIYNN